MPKGTTAGLYNSVYKDKETEAINGGAVILIY